MSNPMNPNSWTVCDEKRFIDRVAKHYGQDRKAMLPSAAWCLRGYLRGLELRWYDFNSRGPMSAGTRQELRKYAAMRIGSRMKC